MLQQSNAKTIFLSNDGNDASDGLSASTPFKTLTKLNAIFSTLNPGDNVLFNRGDVFYGKISINKSGTAAAPITIGAYGTGSDPVITGFTSVTSWANLGSNIWESSSAVSTLPYTNLVTVNGVNTPMGRFPNTGYLIWQTHTGNVIGSPSTITSNSLSGSTNWAGAEVAFNSTTYIISRDKITAQSGGTLTYATPNPVDLFQSPSTYFIQSFIIQNDPRTLDAQNEWHYNPSTKKLRIYSASTPANVQVATVDTIVYLNSRSYITFDNLSFEGANTSIIEGNFATNITIQNCDFNLSGKNAIHGLYHSSLTSMKVQNCTFSHINNNAIDIGISNSVTISHNSIKNTAVIPFMMSSGSKAAQAITAEGASNLIEFNSIDSTGFVGIRFLGSNTTIRNNYINNFCLSFYDGGGIYTWNGPNASYSGIKILNNIVLNGNIKNQGIYLDNLSNGIEISGNSVANCERGIYLNNAYNTQVLNNTSYANSYAVLINKTNTNVTSNIVMKNNIFFAKTSDQKTGFFLTSKAASMPTPFTSDSNYYARPVDDNLTIQTNFNGVYTQRNLAGWQSLNGQDAHSKKSPKAITNVNDLRFEYNATLANKTISLDANYIDAKNNSYNGSITLAPYTSAVLIRNGAATGNKPPSANAGPDQTIILPGT